jgi:hypothetical protein
VIKVEVWDVVDVARVRKEEAAGQPVAPPRVPAADRPSRRAASTVALDASGVDVYKGANAVIMLVDPTRRWTLEYVQREIAKVPRNLNVLVLVRELARRRTGGSGATLRHGPQVNFRDLDSRRVLSRADLEQFMRTQGANVKITECSLLNCAAARSRRPRRPRRLNCMRQATV